MSDTKLEIAIRRACYSALKRRALTVAEVAIEVDADPDLVRAALIVLAERGLVVGRILPGRQIVVQYRRRNIAVQEVRHAA